ncbi:taste receptor type 2 member 8-like [Sphaerodactylus townsendi]|uniref:taste receptor type 2 member 8-like n=1 Tax=Sphaerodactylus townsendi TaxID=933632 RepID=UPI0020270AC7|nr:taste receptor type 2 member 8-like [Sphaerodactylus townsendi]
MTTFLAISFAALVLNILIGMVANRFIVLFICFDWFRRRKLSPTDLILCCLGLSRFIMQMIMILNTSVLSFAKHTYSQKYMWIIITTFWIFMNTLNLWFAAWLSVLYFVKVGIFSHPVLLQMKRRFSRLVPWLLLGSVVFSAALTIITMTISIYVFSETCFFYESLSHNSNSSAVEALNPCRYLPILLHSPSLIPFIVFLFSAIFLISSLWKHIRHLQSSGTGIKDLNTQVHLTAIKTLASFAVLYLFSFVAVIVQPTVPLIHEHLWAITVFQNMSAMYLSGHAIILILVNPKLKQGFVRMLPHLKCCLCEATS